MSTKRIIVIGGSAAGPKAASKARRMNENAEITIFRKPRIFPWLRVVILIISEVFLMTATSFFAHRQEWYATQNSFGMPKKLQQKF